MAPIDGIVLKMVVYEHTFLKVGSYRHLYYFSPCTKSKISDLNDTQTKKKHEYLAPSYNKNCDWSSSAYLNFATITAN